MSDRQTVADANVRADSYFVVRTKARCWHCGMPTPLLALAVPEEHESFELTSLFEELDAEGNAQERFEWQRSGLSALLFYVEDLPAEVREKLHEISSCYRLGYSVATLNSYWANHCEFCGTLLDDHDLHCEPDSAFVMSNGAAQIERLRIERPFEASAGGFSYEPEFFSSLRPG